MIRFILGMLLAVCALLTGRAQTVVSTIEVPRSLSDNRVQHILRLVDGRLVFTTRDHVNVFDGERFDVVQQNVDNSHPLPLYRGAYHVYADAANHLWVKNYQRLWCLQLDPLRFIAPPSEAVDLFVDSRGRVWTVDSLSTLGNGSTHIAVEPNLQDLEAMEDSLYLFYADGSVHCHALPGGEHLYTHRAYSEAMADSLASTSLVAVGADRCFYQLRCGNGCVCQRFDPMTRQWQQLLRTPYWLHTIIAQPDSSVLISCSEGLWRIDSHGTCTLHTQLQLADGSRLSTDINTLCRDNDGALWLGTATRGLLHATPTEGDTVWTEVSATMSGTAFQGLAPGNYVLQVEDSRWDILTPWWRTAWAYTLYIIGVLAVVLGAVWLYLRHIRQQHREEMLLMRIRELTLQAQVAPLNPPERGEDALDSASPFGEGRGGADPFISRAVQLVEDNMGTAGYTVEQLARDLCMERTTLYKRLSAALDQTPTLFIRSVRLRAAAQLLQRGDLTVGQVAERTGFSSSSYLSKCFQEEYGCRPSEYVTR